VVDRLTDTGSGSGLAGDLRYCITQAGDGDSITFGDGVTGTINLSGPLPKLTHSISIDGPGPDLLTVRRDTGGYYRIFSVIRGTTSIAGLTITNGDAEDASGGGGGIYNESTLTVSNCTISGNGANGATGMSGKGGGIDNFGTLTLSNSTVSGNSAPTGVGGGIHNARQMTVSSSTVSGNVSNDGGAGILNQGNLTLTSSTLSGNFSSFAGGSGLCILDPGTVHARNTIIAGNTADYAPDLIGDIGSLGHNLIGNTQAGSGFDDTDLLNVDPLLGPLQGNGGPTKTMALLAGSPALNAGDPAQLGTADQRGVIRTGGVNIGAFQASASTFVLTAPASVTAGVPFDLTVRAVDTFGQPAVGYTDTVHLSSSDGQAVLPADHTFTLTDGGSYTFSGVALRTAGTWTVTATDAGTLTGSGTVTVRPAAANHILLSGPASASAGTPFDLTVTIEDAYGNTVTDYAGTVTFSTDDPDGSVPPDYTFTADDAGRHTFVGGVTLFADGSRITVTDTQMDTLTGSIIVPLG
jgi:hypothetical protein